MNPEMLTGRSVRGAIAYITHDAPADDNPRPTTAARVAWTHCLNLPSDNPELAGRIMQGTIYDAPALKQLTGLSNRGRKLKEPALHLILSWRHDESPLPPHLQSLLKNKPELHAELTKYAAIETTLSALKKLGIEDHQVVLACHIDKDHLHVHAVASRVHPDTGRAAKLSHSKRILNRWAEQYEVDRGQIVTPNRIARREAVAERQKARAEGRQLPPMPPKQRKRGPGRREKTVAERRVWAQMFKAQKNDTNTTEEEKRAQRVEVARLLGQLDETASAPAPSVQVPEPVAVPVRPRVPTPAAELPSAPTVEVPPPAPGAVPVRPRVPTPAAELPPAPSVQVPESVVPEPVVVPVRPRVPTPAAELPPTPRARAFATNGGLLKHLRRGIPGLRSVRKVFGVRPADGPHLRALVDQAVDPDLLDLMLGRQLSRKWVPPLQRSYNDLRVANGPAFRASVARWQQVRRQWVPIWKALREKLTAEIVRNDGPCADPAATPHTGPAPLVAIAQPNAAAPPPPPTPPTSNVVADDKPAPGRVDAPDPVIAAAAIRTPAATVMDYPTVDLNRVSAIATDLVEVFGAATPWAEMHAELIDRHDNERRASRYQPRDEQAERRRAWEKEISGTATDKALAVRDTDLTPPEDQPFGEWVRSLVDDFQEIVGSWFTHSRLAEREETVRAADAFESLLLTAASDPERRPDDLVPAALKQAATAEDPPFVRDVVFELRERYAQRTHERAAEGDASAGEESERRHPGGGLASAFQRWALTIRKLILTACDKILGGRGDVGERVQALLLETAEELDGGPSGGGPGRSGLDTGRTATRQAIHRAADPAESAADVSAETKGQTEDYLVGDELREGAGEGIGAERPAQPRQTASPARDPTRSR